MPRPLRLPPVAEDTPSFDVIREALGRLEADAVPAWGRLNAPRMLRHCSRFMELYLGAIGVHPIVRFMARWFAPRFLRGYIVKPLGGTPRNMRTLQSIRAVEPEVSGFLEERDLFLKALDEVEALQGTVNHGLYGLMRAEDAQALVRHHTAHHFHQFGLI